MDLSHCNPPPGFEPWQVEKHFYATVGPLFMRYADGRMNLGFRVSEQHVNAAEICHGGMLFTLMDIELGFNANVEIG